jgi:hypothetical protein
MVRVRWKVRTWGRGWANAWEGVRVVRGERRVVDAIVYFLCGLVLVWKAGEVVNGGITRYEDIVTCSSCEADGGMMICSLRARILGVRASLADEADNFLLCN